MSDLARQLSVDLAPVPQSWLPRRLLLGLGFGLLVSIVLVLAILGPRPDMMPAMQQHDVLGEIDLSAVARSHRRLCRRAPRAAGCLRQTADVLAPCSGDIRRCSCAGGVPVRSTRHAPADADGSFRAALPVPRVGLLAAAAGRTYLGYARTSRRRGSGKPASSSDSPPAARARLPMPGTATRWARHSSPSGIRSGLPRPRSWAGSSARDSCAGSPAERFRRHRLNLS